MKEKLVAKILEELGIAPVNEDSFQIFVASMKTISEHVDDLKSLADWNAPVLPNLSKLESDEIRFIESEVQKTNLSVEECQIRVQKLIPQERRKKFAAYYTIEQGWVVE